MAAKKTNYLKMLEVALSKDATRMTLCGIHFEPHKDFVQATSTDGHILLTMQIPIKDICKEFDELGILQLVNFESSFIFYPNPKFRVNGKFFSNEVYPHYRNVIPDKTRLELYSEIDYRRPQISPKLLERAQKIYTLLGYKDFYPVYATGTELSTVITPIENGLILLMPLRIKIEGAQLPVYPFEKGEIV